MKKFLVLFMTALMVGSFAVSSVKAEDAPIVIGSIWDQVGIAAPIGQAGLRGSQVAIELINAEGGIFGQKVELYNIDGQSDATLIANASSRLINELNVPCAVGLEDDSLASASAPIFQEAKTVLLVGTATTPTVPGIGDYIFLNAFGDNLQGRAAAKFAYKLGWRKVAVICDSASAYSTDITKFFSNSFKEFTGDENAVVHVENYQTGDTNFTAQLTRLKAVMAKEKVDGIMLAPPFPQDAPIIAKQMKSLDIKLPVLMTDGGDDASVTEVGGDAIEGFMVATHFAADGPLSDSAKQFADKYKEMFKSEPGAFECLGYDGVRTLAEAISSIGKEKWDSMDLAARRTAIRDAIQAHKFVTTALPKYYPDINSAPFPRISIKPVVFKVFKDGGRAYMDMIKPEEM